jgi:hypothetical protein
VKARLVSSTLTPRFGGVTRPGVGGLTRPGVGELAETGKTARERRVEISGQFGPGRSNRGRQGANDQPCTGRQLGKPVDAEMLQLPAHPVAYHCATNLASDHEACSRWAEPTVSTLGIAEHGVRVGKCEVDNKPRAARALTCPHGRGEVRTLAQPGRGRKHGSSRFRATSGRKALTALPTTSGEDGAPGTSAHAQPEAVGLCAPAVVRLERALTHSRAPRRRFSTAVVSPWSKLCGPQVRRNSYGTGPPPTRSNLVPPLKHKSSTRSSTRFTTHSSHRTQLVENALKHKAARC